MNRTTLTDFFNEQIKNQACGISLIRRVGLRRNLLVLFIVTDHRLDFLAAAFGLAVACANAYLPSQGLER